MASDIWQRTTQIVREKTCCHHTGYSFRLKAWVLLYTPSHRQDSTYHSLCYTSHGALAGTRNSSMGPPRRINPTTHCTMSKHSYHGATSCFQHYGIDAVCIYRQRWAVVYVLKRLLTVLDPSRIKSCLIKRKCFI